ncbi:MAG: YjbH domain-containing protein [Deltaproteobacteria bacterium]|nr:YjbH domain-containing protein [Deltaproteobacteria bacterium]
MAKEKDFYSSNWGYTGLLELPDARVMDKEMWRPHVRQVHPYRFYAVSFSPFDGIEITGRVTEILGVKAHPHDPIWRKYGNYKDKAIDLKFRLLREEKYLPQLSLGIMDPHGTRLYPSQYVVMSKKIYPFDITLGLGSGRFGKRPTVPKGEGFYVEMLEDPKAWIKDAKLFFGGRLFLKHNMSFVFEYDPTEYRKQMSDPARKRYFERDPKSKLNVGVTYSPFRWMDLTLAFERGETIGFGISMPFLIGEPLLPISDRPYKEPEEIKVKPAEERIKRCLGELGFSEIGIGMSDGTLFLDIENRKYFYLPKAIHILITNIAPLLPQEVNDVIIIFKERGIPVLSVRTTKEDMLLYRNNEIDFRDFVGLSRIEEADAAPKGEKYLRREFSFNYKPQISLYLNDPSGFWKGKAGIVGWVDYRPDEFFSISAGLSAYPLSNISTVVPPLSIPVRSDIVDYLKRPLWLDRLLFTFMGKLERGPYYRLSLGILELQYTGIDAEIAKPVLDGRLFLGLSGSCVKKRDPENPIKFKKDDVKDYYAPFFANLRLNVPELDVAVDVKGGRFLAGDMGTKVTVSKFIRGVTVSVWAGFTDTSIFKDPYNRGYWDKGVSVQIPIRIFEGKDSRTVYGYSISPWTRDVAQDISHPRSLFEILGRNAKKMLDRDIELFYREK